MFDRYSLLLKLTNYIFLLVGFSGISAGLCGQRTITLPIAEDASLTWHINNSSNANTNYGSDPYLTAQTSLALPICLKISDLYPVY